MMQAVARLSRIFETKKRIYFTRLAFGLRSAVRMHQIGGLRERESGSPGTRRKKPWANISEHCLVEAARAKILSQWLGFPVEWQKKLVLACALHDFGKRQDIEESRRLQETGVSGIDGLVAMEKKHAAELVAAGFDAEVAEISGFGGGLPRQLTETRRLLGIAKPKWEELARLALHWIDDYTRGSDWVEPVNYAKNDRGWRPFNDLCRRIEQNRGNALYVPINMAVAKHISELLAETGATTAYAVQETLGHWIEDKFAELFKQTTGAEIESCILPELIDAAIIVEINKIKLE